MAIRDKIALGTIAGILASIPHIILNYIAVQIGISNYYAFQISGGVFLLKEETSTFLGLLLGGIIWEMASAFLGVIIVYFLLMTGKANWWLKGIFPPVVLMFIGIYGFIFDLGGSKVVPWDIPTNLTMLLGNFLYGIFAAYLVVKLGSHIDFPDYK